MELDTGLKHGFRLGELAVLPLLGEVRSRQDVHRLSDPAVALLIKLAEAPRQIMAEEVLCARLQLNSEQLAQYFAELQQALGDTPEQPHYVRKVAPGYELLGDISINVPPVPTTAQIINGSEEHPHRSEKS
jgi:DNA-binding winged helix-turn-helix (wHTH) protein